MELLSVFKSENQKQHLTQLLPGMTALWPFTLLVLNGLGITVGPSLEWISIVILFIYVIIALGLGVFIEDIGTLIEIRLEGVYFELRADPRGPYISGHFERNPLSIRTLFVSVVRHFAAGLIIILVKKSWRWFLGCHLNKVSYPSKEIAKNEFYNNWSNYLELSFDHENEPVALRYYRSILMRFKFEINMTVAILLMLFGHLILQIVNLDTDHFIKLFSNSLTWLYLAFAYGTISILIVEAFKMIELLDEIRARLITIAKKSSIESRYFRWTGKN